MIRRFLILGLCLLSGCALFSQGARPLHRSKLLEQKCNSIPEFKKAATHLFSTEDQAFLNQWNPQSPPKQTQRDAVTHLSRLYLKNCGPSQVIPLTQTLVQFETTRVHDSQAELDSFAAMANFLEAWSQDANLRFVSHGNNDVLQIGSGTSETLITFVMHADVVPVAEAQGPNPHPPGWHSSPFKAIIEDGKLIGRGTQDDKGPIAAAMVALKTLKAFHLEPKEQITLLMGTDEESSWKHMSKFAKTYPKSKFTISVDAEFPVVYGQSGFVSWSLLAPTTNETPSPHFARVVHLAGGQFLTQVPGDAIMVLSPGENQSQEELLKKVESTIVDIQSRLPTNAYRFNVHADPTQGRIQLQCMGKATHSSKPEQGHNALWPIALIAEQLSLNPSPQTQILKVIAAYFVNDLRGKSLGVAYESPTMGHLVSSANVLRTTDKGVQLSVNMRRPNGKTPQEFQTLLTAALATIQSEVSPSIQSLGKPYVGKVHLANLDNGMVPLLQRIYAETTGDTQSKPHSVRGGTYAKLFPGAVDFGPSKPGDEYRGHSPNEYIRLDTLAELTEMLYEAMVELMKKSTQS